jgi:putative methyltransferase (TIGR04325 family)
MRNQIFEFTYASYKDAHASCSVLNANQDYPAEIWKSRQLSYLTDASLASPRQESISEVLISNQISQVVDFGGGSGWIFRYLSMRDLQVVSRIVIETESSVEWFREFNKEVVWVTKSSLGELEVMDGKSVLYSNSCIQYLEDLKVDFLDLLLKPWEFIILEDIPNVKDSDFWSLQKYYDYKIPYHFFNLQSLVNQIESMGYKLINQINYYERYPENWDYQIKNVNSLITPNSPQTLIFRRFDSTP